MTSKALHKKIRPVGGYWDHSGEKGDRKAKLKRDADKEVRQELEECIRTKQ